MKKADNLIHIVGVKTHNLKNISLKLPKNQLIVITGVSGSGKSSLAFNTIHAEGQYYYWNSIIRNNYLRRYLKIQERGIVEKIVGLSPTLAIEQKNVHNNPRSTIGTNTEIYDYLRILYANIGKIYCPNGHGEVVANNKDKILIEIQKKFQKQKIIIYSEYVITNPAQLEASITRLIHSGCDNFLIGETTYNKQFFERQHKTIRANKLLIVIDKLVVQSSEDAIFTLEQSLNSAHFHTNNFVIIVETTSGDLSEHYSTKRICLECQFVPKAVSNLNFSFNSPIGCCLYCKGIGVIYGPNENLIFDFELSIAEGGVLFFANFVDSSNKLWQEFNELCKFYQIDKTLPIKQLPAKHISVLLFGSKSKLRYEITIGGTVIKQYRTIEGVGARIARLHQETTSERARMYYKSFLSEIICKSCHGARINKQSLHILVLQQNIHSLCKMTIFELLGFFAKLPSKLKQYECEIIKNLLPEIINRLSHINNIGLGYLTLARVTYSLSTGEYQRIRISSQLGSHLNNILYIFDEPTVGLHAQDNDKLINMLRNLKEKANTIIIVEHDEDVIRSADYIVEIGPKSGSDGGQIVDSGPIADVLKRNVCLTAQYINHSRTIKIRNKVRKISWSQKIGVICAYENNLQRVTLDFPLHCFVVVTGVSGSGKSSLINNIIYRGIKQQLGEKTKAPGKFKRIINRHVQKIVYISQRSIGKTIRSNPATYVGVFTLIRELFAKTYMAKIHGFTPSNFSFNTNRGACYKCLGKGVNIIELIFMPNLKIKCNMCGGKKFRKEILAVTYHGYSIFDCLQFTVTKALTIFKNHPRIVEKLDILARVGLGYLKLGQSSDTLSGGESQRVKIAANLLKKGTKEVLYLLDEPTIGLHANDVDQLLTMLRDLIQQKNASLIIIEHNLHVIKNADYLIELGPCAGKEGGKIINKGNLDQFLNISSPTSNLLNQIITPEELLQISKRNK